jgi:hypothetical protein
MPANKNASRGNVGTVVPFPGGEPEAERRRIRSSNDHDQQLEQEGKTAPHNAGYDQAADGTPSPEGDDEDADVDDTDDDVTEPDDDVDSADDDEEEFDDTDEEDEEEEDEDKGSDGSAGAE